MKENRQGKDYFKRLHEEGKEHKIEQVGRALQFPLPEFGDERRWEFH